MQVSRRRAGSATVVCVALAIGPTGGAGPVRAQTAGTTTIPATAGPAGNGSPTGTITTGNAQAGNAQTGNAQTGNAQTGNAQTGNAQAGSTQAGSTRTGNTQPRSTQPGTTQPRTTQAGTTQPGTTPSAIVPGTRSSADRAPADVSIDNRSEGRAPVNGAVAGGVTDGGLDSVRTVTALRRGTQVQQGVAVPSAVGTVVRNVSVSLNGAATYDSNATQSNSLRTSQSNLDQSDIIVPIGVSISASIPQGANAYFLNGFVGYNFRARNSGLSSENIGINAGYSRQYRSCSGSLDTSISRNQSQAGDTNLIIVIKNIQTSTSIGGALSCAVTLGIRPFVSANYIQSRNGATLLSLNDRNTLTYGGGIVDAIPSLGEVGLIASIDDTSYPNRILGGATSVKAKSIGIYFQRNRARILQLRVQANYTSVDSGSPTGQFKGLSGSARVGFMPGGRFSFVASADRAAVPSLSFTSDYELDTTVGAQASAAINPKMSARIGYTRQHRKFFGVVALIPALALTNDTTDLASAGLGYSLSPRISLSFSTVHSRRRANNPLLSYSGTRASIGVSIGL